MRACRVPPLPLLGLEHAGVLFAVHVRREVARRRLGPRTRGHPGNLGTSSFKGARKRAAGTRTASGERLGSPRPSYWRCDGHAVQLHRQVPTPAARTSTSGYRARRAVPRGARGLQLAADLGCAVGARSSLQRAGRILVERADVDFTVAQVSAHQEVGGPRGHTLAPREDPVGWPGQRRAPVPLTRRPSSPRPAGTRRCRRAAPGPPVWCMRGGGENSQRSQSGQDPDGPAPPDVGQRASASVTHRGRSARSACAQRGRPGEIRGQAARLPPSRRPPRPGSAHRRAWEGGAQERETQKASQRRRPRKEEAPWEERRVAVTSASRLRRGSVKGPRPRRERLTRDEARCGTGGGPDCATRQNTARALRSRRRGPRLRAPRRRQARNVPPRISPRSRP